MDQYKVHWFVLVHFATLVTSFFLVEGRISSLSIEENLELDKELSSLNKPAVKIIKTEYGDIYNCVDLHKQPAFDHPSLKDQKIQMRPSFASRMDMSTASTGSPVKFGLKDKCPAGTVPIRRTTKEELLRAKSNFQKHFQGPYSVNEDENEGVPGFVFAGISTTPNNGTTFRGVGGYSSIYNPTAGLEQFSASVISIEGGSVEQFSTMRVGWMVNPSLFQDSRTRLYTIWGQGTDGVMRGCYDTYCSGFVQISTEILLGSYFDLISVIGGEQFYLTLSVNQDENTKNWWLTCGAGNTPIGYWPNSLFTNFNNGAEVLRWGGMVYSSVPQLPQMGNGDNGDLNAHFRRVSLQNEAGSSLNGIMDVPLEVQKTKCYKVGDNNYMGEFWGYGFWFGGNGGDVSECS